MAVRDIPGITVDAVGKQLHRYGLGVLFAANVFGAGSVYILADTGANIGFALLWVLPLALVVDLVMHEMSGRLASVDEPLMEYFRDVLGNKPAVLMAAIVAFVMHFWSVANYAVAGAALAWLTPLNNVSGGILLTAGFGIALIELRVYERIEAAITALVLSVFGTYVILMFGVGPNVTQVASGFIPAIRSDIGYLTAVVAMLGTTVYYPNFFIQSSIHPTKGWTKMKKYRKDNFVGISGTILLSIAVLIVSATTLAEGELALTGPGEPLTQFLGPWALTAFVFAALLASFTSATGTLFGAGYLVPQSMGHKTEFGDRWFRGTVVFLIVSSVTLAIPILLYTNMTPVRLAITMPAVNGVIGLPLTALGLYFANKRHFDHPPWLRAVMALVVLLMFAMSALTAESLYHTIVGWL